MKQKKVFSLCLLCVFMAMIAFPASCPDAALAAGGSGTFTITSPSGGEVYHAGETQTVSWTYTGEPGAKVNLTLYTSGRSIYPIARGVPVGADGTGTYTWKILAPYVAEGDEYTVRIFSATNSKIEAFSEVFSVTHEPGGGESAQEENPPANQESQLSNQTGTVIIDDPSFVTLTAVSHPADETGALFHLNVKANNASAPVEVSYLVLNPNASPNDPSQGIAIGGLGGSENGWGGSQQYYGHTEVGGWALPQYQANPQSFALPHYRTCVMMLARYEKIYVVFIRENDGQLSYKVFQGGAFNGLEVPGLGQVVQNGSQFQVHSLGGAVELGIWDKGTYQHDEVTGWAQASYQANDKLYSIPKYGMFMMAIGRYGKLGLIMGNYNDGRLGTVCFAGSDLLGTQSVPGLCELTGAGGSNIQVRATGGDPVEVSQFAFDNTCWQWEVGGWGQEAFRANPQVLPLKHYTPGIFTGSRYDKAGIFLYNENDGQLGVLPLNSSTQVAGSRVVQIAAQPVPAPAAATSSGDIRVLLNGRQLTFDQPPVIIDGTTVVPMRAIFEALGAGVNWNGASQTVTASDNTTTIILVIGMPNARVNGHESALSQPAQLIGGRTMVPLRFVAEAMQCDVNWDGPTRTITIDKGASGDAAGTASGKQVVDYFFSSLGSGNIDDALAMMDGDAASLAAWKSSFETFDTLDVIDIQDWNAGQWTSTGQVFKVEFALRLKSGAPETMWMDGKNTRWVSVNKVNGQWKIGGLATGP